MAYITGKREKIIEYMRENSDRAFSLEEICEGVLDGTHGRSTVYRLVSELAESGIIKRLADGKTRHTTYQYLDKRCFEHLHLKCRECGRLVHLDAKISQDFKDKLSLGLGFSLDGATLLFGRCNACLGEVKGNA